MMRALYGMTLTEAKLFLREPAAVFFTLAFPAMVLLLFGSVFGGYPVPGTDLRAIDIYTPSYTGMVIGTVALIGLPTTLASYRERGVLRRLRAAPLRPSTVLASYVIVHLLATAAGVALLFLAARLAFGLRMPEAPFPVALALVFASLSLFAAGFLLAGLLPTVRVASAVGQAIFFPMLFLSGALLPREQLPEALRQAGDFLPLTHAVALVRDLWLGEGWNLAALAFLAGTMAVSVAVSSRTFRWE